MKYTETVLVTAIGSFSSDCVVDSLKEKKTTKVIGCDIYPFDWHAVSIKFDAFYQVPYVSDQESYLKKIIDICKIESINFIFPLTDVEVDLFNLNRQIFKDLGVVICIPSSYALSIARDKIALADFVKNEMNFPSIQTFRANEELTTAIFPLIAKPVDGRSSEGIMIIHNTIDLGIIQKKQNYLLQEVIDGPVFTVDYVRSDFFNMDFSVPRKELLRTKNGAGMTVELDEIEELSKMASSVGQRLRINGCINIEFILSQGKFYLIDINPRFSAGVAFSKLAGYDMVKSHFNCFQNENIIMPIKIKKRIAIKKIIDIITSK